MSGCPWGKAITGWLPTMHLGGFRAKGAALCHEGGLSPPSNSPHLYFFSPLDHCLPLCVDTTEWKIKIWISRGQRQALMHPLFGNSRVTHKDDLALVQNLTTKLKMLKK